MPCGVVIALDRQERGTGAFSATQEVTQNYAIPVVSIATLDDMIGYLRQEPGMAQKLEAVLEYKDRYGVSAD